MFSLYWNKCIKILFVIIVMTLSIIFVCHHPFSIVSDGNVINLINVVPTHKNRNLAIERLEG